MLKTKVDFGSSYTMTEEEEKRHIKYKKRHTQKQYSPQEEWKKIKEIFKKEVEKENE